MPTISKTLVVLTRRTLGLSQGELGAMLQMAKRTIQRWEQHGGLLAPSHLGTIVAAVHPRDATLAARIAKEGGSSLLELGLEKAPAPPPPAPPPPPPLPTATLVDAIVCVAADAIGVAPSVIRPALAAAFTRAREVRLDVGAVADSLTEAEVAAKGRAKTRSG